jgi:hypothetical protein
LRSDARQRPRLLPVVINAELQPGVNAEARAQVFEVMVGGVTVRVVSGADVQYAATLVAALRDAGC